MRHCAIVLFGGLFLPLSLSVLSGGVFDPNQTDGRVLSVDTVKKSITVAVEFHGLKRDPQTFTANEKTRILVGDKQVSLAEVRPGMQVRIEGINDPFVTSIVATSRPEPKEPPTAADDRMNGTVTAIDLNKRTLTLMPLAGTGGGVSQTFTVADTTAVFVHGERASIRDIVPGMRVRIPSSAGTSIAKILVTYSPDADP
jgi:hypothetical protein